MITDSFDNKSEPLMKLSDFYGQQKHIIDVCIITFSHVIYTHLLEKYDCKVIGNVMAANGIYPIYSFIYKGKEIGFYLSPIGSTMASQFTIEVNWITGANKFVLFGSAGSLNKEMTTNKYVIPVASYRDEGMSYHYLPASDYISIKNAEKVKEIMDELNLNNVTGKIWTTDAFLRETENLVKARQNDGCIAVEMEIAGVEAVSRFYGYDLYPFVVTGDVLSEPSYEVEGLNDANHNLDKLYVALEIALRV